MKKLALFVACLMISGFVFADVNFDALKASHINAMKYYGRSANVENGQMVFMVVGDQMASVYFGEDLSTGYVEKDEKKFYWEVTPIEGGVKIYIKVNILGKVYEKTIIIKFGDKQFSVLADGSTDDRVDWTCLLNCATGSAAPCLSCIINKDCWISCIMKNAPGLIGCVMGCF